jgi:phospholipase C
MSSKKANAGAAPETATPESTGTTRRRFLQASGIAAAGAVVGGATGGAIGAAIGHSLGVADERDELDALDPRSVPGFDHLIVVMGENRSFDNLLGYLYDKETLPKGQRFDGLAFGDHSNTAPDGTVIPAHVYTGSTDEIMGSPSPDPGEEYPHVNTQLFNRIDPAGNADLWVDDMTAPFNAPASGTKASMDGFVTDYDVNYRRLHKGKAPSGDELATIMGSFSPAMLPVLSTLAQNFAVYDNWYCAVPSQTFCNRSFFHASTSHGFVTNKDGGGYNKWIDAPAAPTIFNRLEDAGVNWRIYFDAMQLVSFTGVLHAPVLEKYWKTGHFATMDSFYDDVKNGKLPAYAFIEPRMVYNHNDFHPPFGKLRESDVDGVEIIDSAISDVRAGEALIHQIYSAVRDSASPSGSNAMNTMLFITFDEHGGTYDHVAPPKGVKPDDAGAGEMGFEFDRLGCRVPAIAISAYTRASTVINDEMHHGSLSATLARIHGLKPLNERDATANTMFNAVNLKTPRQPVSWPHTTPQYIPPNPQAEVSDPGNADKDKPLSPPGRGLLGLLLAKFAPPGTPVPETYGQAYEHLEKYGSRLFGRSQR